MKRGHSPRKRLSRLVLVVALLTIAVAAPGGGPAGAAAKNGKVLILDTTVTGGAGSREAQAAIAAGHGVDVVSAATWGSMTAAQFAAYDALILGDPTCTGPGTGSATAAINNRSVWSPVIDGNMIVIGTDEVYHNYQGGQQLTTSAVKFAADATGKTGLLVSLSCYYHGTAPLTPIPLLDQFGTGFKASGVGCYNNAHIVATHPALAGLTDASLSNWSCSVHEAISSYPSDFLPLAIARGVSGPGSMTFPDGSFGIPYILARGEGLRFISNIDLAPAVDTKNVGTPETLTATVKENGTAVAGATVTFSVTSGPNAGLTGTGVTDTSGHATFTYTSAAAGDDMVQASYRDSHGTTQTSGSSKITWLAPFADLSITKTGPALVTEGGNVTYVLSVSNAGPANATGVTVADPLPAGETVVSATPSQGTCSDGVTCALGSIANGGSASITIVASVAVGTPGPLANTATVGGNQPDNNTANNTSNTVTTNVNHNPSCTGASAGPNLWPPNHKWVWSSISGVTDPDGNTVAITITGIWQDEPTNGLGDGDTAIDGQIGVGNSFAVRAERSGLGDGRVYHVFFSASDGLGGSCTGSALIGVPHDQGKGSTPIDGGALYNSLL